MKCAFQGFWYILVLLHSLTHAEKCFMKQKSWSKVGQYVIEAEDLIFLFLRQNSLHHAKEAESFNF